MWGNTTTSWGWVARTLHWLMAALILGQIVLGKYAQGLALSPVKLNAMMWHKSLGIVLLLLVTVRLTWAWLQPRPGALGAGSRWQQFAARLSHILLYVLMITVPLCGWLMNSAKNVPFSLFRVLPLPVLVGPDEHLGKLFQWLHEILGNTLLILITFHVLAALWHHFLSKDEVLCRMLGFGAKS